MTSVETVSGRGEEGSSGSAPETIASLTRDRNIAVLTGADLARRNADLIRQVSRLKSIVGELSKSILPLADKGLRSVQLPPNHFRTEPSPDHPQPVASSPNAVAPAKGIFLSHAEYHRLIADAERLRQIRLDRVYGFRLKALAFEKKIRDRIAAFLSR